MKPFFFDTLFDVCRFPFEAKDVWFFGTSAEDGDDVSEVHALVANRRNIRKSRLVDVKCGMDLIQAGDTAYYIRYQFQHENTNSIEMGAKNKSQVNLLDYPVQKFRYCDSCSKLRHKNIYFSLTPVVWKIKWSFRFNLSLGLQTSHRSWAWTIVIPYPYPVTNFKLLNKTRYSVQRGY